MVPFSYKIIRTRTEMVTAKEKHIKRWVDVVIDKNEMSRSLFSDFILSCKRRHLKGIKKFYPASSLSHANNPSTISSIPMS